MFSLGTNLIKSFNINKCCMMSKDVLRIEGRVRIRVFKLGRLERDSCSRNTITSAGKAWLSKLMVGQAEDSLLYCGVGSSDREPSEGDTDLVSPIGQRKPSSDRFTTNNVATISTFFGSQDNNGVWREVGLFTKETGGVMFARALIDPPITKDETKTVTVDWDVTVG